MMDIDVLGIGLWSDAYRGWPSFVASFEMAVDSTTIHAAIGSPPDGLVARASRPSPSLLPPAERRRAPDGVAVALEVASEAVTMAASCSIIDPTTLATVFTSAHGDLAIVDYLCTTLATDPTALSPTRFHLSVHNAAAGNWSIATHDEAPATALAGGDDSFALGLLEAATMAVAEHRPVLLVAFDTPAVGLLAAAARNTALFGCAMIVAPTDAAVPAAAGLTLAIERGATPLPLPLRAGLRALAASSPAARALALAERLVTSERVVAEASDPSSLRASTVRYPLGPDSALSVFVRQDWPGRSPVAAQPIE